MHASADSARCPMASLRQTAGLRPAPCKILYVTSEISDFVKVGGLGDVSAALPRALRDRCDVRVLVPGYRQVLQSCPSLPIVGHLDGLADIPPCDIAQIRTADDLVVYVLVAPALYDRDGTPYGRPQDGDWRDNDIRFARLALAAADIAGGRVQMGWQPDLLHLNDWPTALAAGYAKWRGSTAPSLLTIHNLAYQGLF